MKALLTAIAGALPLLGAAQTLEADFLTPPNSAKPIMIWQWMDGVVSYEGITADLEAYREAGIGGVQQFQIGGPLQSHITDPRFDIGTDEWRSVMRHSLDECKRLGLSFGTHNCPGWSSSASPEVLPEYSMQQVVWTDTVVRGKRTVRLPRPATDIDYYRDIAVVAIPAGGSVHAPDVTVLKASARKDGTLECKVPKGEWRVYRFGHTSNGKTNWGTSPESGRGLECDKLSREALDRYWSGYPSTLLDIAGDDCGTVFTRIEIDSYEAGGQEWTRLLPEEFMTRKGYDILPWLPAIAGVEINGPEATKQFVADWKDVITDLMAENYYGYMSELIHRVPGMKLLAQPYGTGHQRPFAIVDTRKALAQIAPDDHICVEFWTNPVSWGWPQVPGQVDMIRDAGHDIIYAEGFTCWPLNAWMDTPNSLKIIADKAFCHGVNSLMLHAGAQNPWPGVQPGMTMGMWGTQWTPGQTWWQSGGAKRLFDYMARCQALLQKGTCVDDFRSRRGTLTADTDSLEWTHRVSGGDHIYFVTNISSVALSPTLSVDAAGLVPEIWHPETLSRVEADAWESDGARTSIALDLEPHEAVFVVMRERAVGSGPGLDNRAVTAREGRIAVSTPWTVTFPADSGAPAEITLDSLVSLHQHPEAGVRYFSGTCTYSTEIDLGDIDSGKTYTLDLGNVQNLAKVRVNGNACADLWHGPFKADISPWLVPGRNTLEIDVTNTWVNRMIGDEQYPDDIEWCEPETFGATGSSIGRFMKEVPAWLRDGTERPQKERKTVYVFKYFDKDSPLVSSGLIGPVAIDVESVTRPRARQDFTMRAGSTVRVSMPGESRPVLATAVEMFARDMDSVLGSTVATTRDAGEADIVISIDPQAVEAREGFTINVGDDGRLHITGHDSHGAAYGLLEVSRLAGVSPWEWWADAVPARRQQVVIPGHYSTAQSPSVAYRGIFINDEDWGLMPWSYLTNDPQEKGVVGPETTARIFELLLRLRANTYWPPMHECTQPFFLTEGNREVAEKYGIYVGGSHCEPMACSTAGEWPRRGEGSYDYVSNADGVRRFWQSRLDEVSSQEIVYTVGMRGVHDGAMQGANGVEQQKEVLSRVLADQRRMLADAGLADAPQVFIPYKEVLDIYDAGLEVPDDVTLMWTDDNYGYIRHFPTEAERARAGGNGVYYHVSYWGRPHDYLWLGTFSPGLLYQQMHEAYTRGIDRMWILNVGDIKPAEYQIELFMDMGWDMDAVQRKGVERHCSDFLAREFGPEAASALLPVMREHYRLAHVRKPEFMGNTRTEERDRQYWNTVRSLPWSESYVRERIAAYDELSQQAESIAALIPAQLQDEYFQLVKYPVQGAAQMNMKALYAQLSRQGKAEWAQSRAAYDSIQALTAIYNDGIANGGKWRHMMDSHPRRLPVFDPVDEHSTDSVSVADTRPLAVLNGTDGTGYTRPCEWLGYDNSAVYIAKADTAVYSVATDRGSVTLDLRLLPTHTVDGTPQAFALAVDGVPMGTIDYSTAGRSEEWKENVLHNQARRSIDVELDGSTPVHRIEITPLTGSMMLDQIHVRERQPEGQSL